MINTEIITKRIGAGGFGHNPTSGAIDNKQKRGINEPLLFFKIPNYGRENRQSIYLSYER
jgi:hypothetical protein